MIKNRASFWVLVVLLLFTLNMFCANYSKEKDMSKYYKRYRGNAPEFPSGLEWLNTKEPLKMQELRGKFVLLDFWTYCCINCIHIIPDLKKLEEKYDEELVVIGVHSAKFSTEKDSDNIRSAILRYEIEHPVVNDKDFQIWRNYSARAWPTVVLVDPIGDIIGYKTGERIYDVIDRTISEEMNNYADVLDRTPIEFELEKEKSANAVLRFPGKILAHEDSKRLFIADSNNNRIIVTDFDGAILDVIGAGSSGQTDGVFEEAEFFHPQGIALDGENLYIADTENHLIRKADLTTRNVETIAGLGYQSYNDPSGDARNAGLNSPWDLTIHDNMLYIAMAGQHQLWAIDLATNNIRLHAGTGGENIVDKTLKRALLAQPSGITNDGEKLYFADSEVSAIRAADIDPDGDVNTIIGQGLFEFGDIDGDRLKARLQHPLGITLVDGMLYIADTYNNKIKRVNPNKQISQTYAGSGDEGMEDGKRQNATFDEPGGISYANEKLYVADTNNHLIRIIDMNTDTVSTLELTNLEKLVRAETLDLADFRGDKIKSESIAPTANQLKFKFELPKNYKLNDLAPSQIRLFSKDGKLIKSQPIKNLEQTLEIKETLSDKIYADISLYYCQKGNEGLCLIKNLLYEIPIDEDGTTDVELGYRVRRLD